MFPSQFVPDKSRERSISMIEEHRNPRSTSSDEDHYDYTDAGANDPTASGSRASRQSRQRGKMTYDEGIRCCFVSLYGNISTCYG